MNNALPGETKGAGGLLTIAIPSYNRAEWLTELLESLYPQMADRDAVDVIVCDNNSTDNTRDVVDSFAERGMRIRYEKNHENIGSSANVVRCFELVESDFALIMGDDDILLPGALDEILSVLAEGNIGLLYLRAFPFIRDHRAEQPEQQVRQGAIYYESPRAFLDHVLINLTFLSSVVVNKASLPADFDPKRFRDSLLPHLAWIFETLFSYPRHAMFDAYKVAGRADNSGGYALCEVFGQNLDEIIEHFVRDGIAPENFKMLRAFLIRRFLPQHLLELRAAEHRFLDEEYHAALRPVYGRYLSYWLCLYPVLHLPVPLASAWLQGLKVLEHVRARSVKRRHGGAL